MSDAWTNARTVADRMSRDAEQRIRADERAKVEALVATFVVRADQAANNSYQGGYEQQQYEAARHALVDALRAPVPSGEEK